MSAYLKAVYPPHWRDTCEDMTRLFRYDEVTPGRIHQLEWEGVKFTEPSPEEIAAFEIQRATQPGEQPELPL